MSMSKEAFQQTFHTAVALDFAEIPTEEVAIDVTFSDAFLQKMDRLIVLEQQGIWSLLGVVRRHAAMIAIVLLGFVATSCGVNYVITQSYINIYKEMFQEYYEGTTAMEIAYEYEISQVPEGFEKVEVSKTKLHKYSEYENKEGDKIRFCQHAKEKYEMSLLEPQVTRTATTIRGFEVEIFENADVIGAMWIEDGYFMELRYYGCEDVEEVIALIASIE